MNIHNKKLVNSKSYIKNINHANETHPKTKHSNDKKKKPCVPKTSCKTINMLVK